MKTIKLYALCLMAAVAIFGTSCSKEQTSLTIEEIPGRAKVIGQVFYPTGTEWKAGATAGSGTIVPTFAVATNKKVIIEVQNSEFKSSAANGIIVFETTTDAKGNYEIEVPISGIGSMQVTIKTETFTGDTKEYDGKSETNAPIYKIVPVTYSYTEVLLINSTTVTVSDITYTSTPRTLHN